MAEIVDFKSRDKKINEDIIHNLKVYLELAEKGELIALGLAGVMKTGDTLTCACQSDNFPALVGSISILHHRLVNTPPV